MTEKINGFLLRIAGAALLQLPEDWTEVTEEIAVDSVRAIKAKFHYVIQLANQLAVVR